MTSPRVPRARAKRPESDEGVRRCVDLMTSGRWVTGRSHRELAVELQVSPRTVESWATNASRIVRLAVEGDVQDVRARMLATLDTIIAKAVSGTKPDLRAAVAAVDSQARLLGIAKSEVHLSGSLAALAGGAVDDQIRVTQGVLRALESQKEN